MVGDRADDILAGKIHGLYTIAVSYGYGSPFEIKESQPDFTAQSVADLDQWFQSTFPRMNNLILSIDPSRELGVVSGIAKSIDRTMQVMT